MSLDNLLSIKAATVDGAVDVSLLKMFSAERSSLKSCETSEATSSLGPGASGGELGGGADIGSAGKRRFRHRRLFPFEAHGGQAAAPHPFVDGNSRITVIDYSHEKKRMFEVDSVDELLARPKPEWAHVRWVNVEGVDVTILSQLGAAYKLHPLSVEDAATLPHQPKLTRFPGQFFLLLYAMHMYVDNDGGRAVASVSPTSLPGATPLHANAASAAHAAADASESDDVASPASVAGGHEFRAEQLSLFVLRDMVITVQEAKHPQSTYECIWKPVLDRVNYPNSKLRSGDATFLMYAILDSVVDQVFPITSFWGLRVELLEEAMMKAPDRTLLDTARLLQKELKRLRTLLWQTNELVISLHQDTNMSLSTRAYMTDVMDHLGLNIQMCSTYVDAAAAVVSMYNDFQNEVMNNTMKRLTVFSNILMPLSFLTGTYGMNFEVLPELTWRYSYLFFWIVAVVSSVLQLIWFHKKGWL